MSEVTKPPLGAKPAAICAWSRIGELAAAIERNYQAANGNVWLCKQWAQEIVAQCEIIQRFPIDAREDLNPW